MDKKMKILRNLKNTYCRLRYSRLHGVGVFAVRDIPANVNPFSGVRKQKWHEFTATELKELDSEVIRMIEDFFVIEKDGGVFIPEYGLNGMDMSFFVNDSGKPNMKTVNNGITFITLRKIRKGEELTVSYRTYDHNYRKR